MVEELAGLTSVIDLGMLLSLIKIVSQNRDIQSFGRMFVCSVHHEAWLRYCFGAPAPRVAMFLFELARNIAPSFVSLSLFGTAVYLWYLL